MRNLIIIFLFFTFSCNPSLNNDHELNEIFTKEEIEFFNEIQKYFNSYVISEFPKNNISDSYNAFCEKLMNSLTIDSINNSIYIDSKSLKRFSIIMMENPFFYELWTFDKLFNYDTKEIVREEININPNGKALKLLTLLKKKYKFYDIYYNSVIEFGGLSPSLYGGYHFAHDKLNFDDPKVRLWTAIHYLTLKMSYTDIFVETD